MNNPEISVIVPVYNAEKYLHRCIDSILAQTFTDFGLLLIDDGSPDLSGNICDEYAQKDNRVRVFHQKNGGVSSARNLGIDNASGKWIAFVDSDDVVDNSYLESMLPHEIPVNTLIMASYANVGIPQRHLPKGFYQKDGMVRNVMENHLLNLSGPYAKLYNLDIIKKNRIRFPEGIHMGEDGIFIIRYLNSIENILFVDETHYFINTTAGSLSSRYYDFSSEWKCFEIWKTEVSKFVLRYDGLFKDSNNIIWNNRIGETFLRCLYCSFMLPNLTMKERLAFLEKIPAVDYEMFNRHVLVKGHIAQLQKMIIHKKLYGLFVVFGMFLKKIKKIQ